MSGYLKGVLDEFHASLSPASSRAGPYLGLPAGQVQVGTAFDSGGTGLTWLQFGGNAGGVSRGSSNTLDIRNEVSWTPLSARHQFKFSQEIEGEWDHSLRASNAAGMFAYQSLADLAAGDPASYQRTIAAASYSGHASSASLSLGDSWRAIRGVLDLTGGIRFDMSRFGTVVPYNPAVDSLFGVRTDLLPTDHGFSPRLGFSWTPGARAGSGPTVGPGQMMIMPGGEMAGRGGRDETGLGLLPSVARGVTLVGGFGAFRGVIPAGRITSLLDATGLPSTTRYLACVGAATPVADWSAGAPSPDRCLDGTAPEAFSADQPAVTVFDPGYRAPVSWRAQVQLRNWEVAGWEVVPIAAWSIGVNNPGRVDLNLRRNVAFTLLDEDGRPVYAAAADIDPSSGLIAPAAARISSSYASVTRTVSDLHYHAEQVSLILVPPHPLFGAIPLQISYSYNAERLQERGFGGNTAGDPFAVAWIGGAQPTHQIRIVATNIRIWWFTAAAQFNLFSGVRYTPMVSGDINGDGLANDRAFIADPASTPDSALASQMTALLAGAPGSARRCLTAQFGAIAAANSCHTPWLARIDLNLAFTPPATLGLGNRLHFTTTLINAGSGLVRLFGLENTPLGQTPTSASVDPRLLYVTGFDSATQSYRYRVNQLFGEPLNYGTGRHRYPPFQLQIGAQYDFGGPSPTRTVTRLGLVPAPATGAIAPDQALAALRRSVPDYVARILDLRDSLHLNVEQLSALQVVDRQFNHQVDSMMAPLVRYIVKRGKKLIDADLLPRVDAVAESMAHVISEARKEALARLTPVQQQLLLPPGMRPPREKER